MNEDPRVVTIGGDQFLNRTAVEQLVVSAIEAAINASLSAITESVNSALAARDEQQRNAYKVSEVERDADGRITQVLTRTLGAA